VLIVVVIVIATTANVVVNVKNVVDFQWCPSNLRIYPHPYMDIPHPLKTLYHALY
jgi:hypothetical protein